MFFHFKQIPFEGVIHMLYKKNVKADILKILPHMLAILLQCWKYRRRDNFCLLPRILVINKQSKKKIKEKIKKE